MYPGTAEVYSLWECPKSGKNVYLEGEGYMVRARECVWSGRGSVYGQGEGVCNLLERECVTSRRESVYLPEVE